jgi:lipase
MTLRPWAAEPSAPDLGRADPSYRALDVEVEGGLLRVGRWGSGRPVVVAVHGLTLTHAQFHPLGRQLADRATVVAPDLRGRGASASLGPPYGMAAHARDVLAVVDHLAATAVTLVGYSTGAAIAVLAAAARPGVVDRVVMVDGGPPPRPRPPDALPAEAPVAHVLERLGRTFASTDAYLDTWRVDPGLAADWDQDVARVFAGDLVGVAPQLRVGIRPDALVADSSSYLDGREVDRAFDALRGPVVLATAPRGMGASDAPLVPAAKVRAWQRRLPELGHVVVPDVNHHTILFSERGARAVAAMIDPGVDGPGGDRRPAGP